MKQNKLGGLGSWRKSGNPEKKAENIRKAKERAEKIKQEDEI